MYAVMNDHETCEIFIQKIPKNTDIDSFVHSHSGISSNTVSRICTTMFDAKKTAHAEAVMNMWTYNPERNSLI